MCSGDRISWQGVPATYDFGSCACGFLLLSLDSLASPASLSVPDSRQVSAKVLQLALAELNSVQREVSQLEKTKTSLLFSVHETQDQLDSMFGWVRWLKPEKEGLHQERHLGLYVELSEGQ